MPLVLRGAKKYGPTIARAGGRLAVTAIRKRRARKNAARVRPGMGRMTAVSRPTPARNEVTYRVAPRKDEIFRSSEALVKVSGDGNAGSTTTWLCPLAPSAIGTVEPSSMSSTQLPRLDARACQYQFFYFNQFSLSYNASVATSTPGRVEVAYYPSAEAAAQATANGTPDLSQGEGYTSYPAREPFVWTLSPSVLAKAAYKRYQYKPSAEVAAPFSNEFVQGFVVFRLSEQGTAKDLGHMVADYTVNLTSPAIPNTDVVGTGLATHSSSGALASLTTSLSPWMFSTKDLGSGIVQMRLCGRRKWLIGVAGASSAAVTISYHEDTNCSASVLANVAATTKYGFVALITLTDPLLPAFFSLQVTGATNSSVGNCFAVPFRAREASGSGSLVPSW